MDCGRKLQVNSVVRRLLPALAAIWTGTAFAQVSDLPYSPQAQLAYVAYYGRPGDPGGVTFWANRLAGVNGNWSTDVVNAFGNSPEFQNNFGSLDSADLIRNLFSQLFNRSVDPEGLAFYTDLLQGTNDSGLNDARRQSSFGVIAIDVANGAQGRDAEVVNRKLLVAGNFTDKIESTGRSYGAEDIAAAASILAAASQDFSLTIDDINNCTDRYIAALYLTGSCGDPEINEIEPNDSVANATPIDLSLGDVLINGSLSGSLGGDVIDHFAFALNSEELLNFDVTPGFTVTIRDEQGQAVAQVGLFTGPVSIVLPAGVLYTAEVAPGIPAAIAGGDYQLSISMGDADGAEQEPNDSFAEANAMGTLLDGATGNRRFVSRRGSFDPTSDPIDRYRISIGELSFTQFAVDLQIPEADLASRVFDTCLYRDDFARIACLGGGVLPVEALPAGDYYLGIESTAASTDVVTPYVLGASSAVFRTGGGSILDARPFPLDLTEISGRIEDAQSGALDEEWFRFAADATQSKTVRLLIPDDSNVQVELFDENLFSLGVAGRSPGEPGVLSFDVDLEKDVEYFFQVTRTDDAGGFYILSLLEPEPTVTPGSP